MGTVGPVIVLVLSLVSLAVSVGVLVYARRATRTWRRVAEGWERNANRWRAVAEQREREIDQLIADEHLS